MTPPRLPLHARQRRTPWQRLGNGSVRQGVGLFTFLVVRNDGTAPVTLAFTAYERLPLGRFTRTVWSDPVAEVPSAYSYSITEFDTTREAGPTVVVWGSNRAGATKVVVVSGATTASFDVSDAAYFVGGDLFPADATSSVFDIAITFFDAAGRDVTGEFGTY